jgi:hypothetical protein
LHPVGEFAARLGASANALITDLYQAAVVKLGPDHPSLGQVQSHLNAMRDKVATGDVALVQGARTVRRQVRSGIGEHVDVRVSSGGWTIVFVFFSFVPESGPAQHEEIANGRTHADAPLRPPCLHMLWNKALDGNGAWKRKGKSGDDRAVDAVQDFAGRGRSAAAAAVVEGRGSENLLDRARAYHSVSVLPNTAYLFPGKYVSHYVDPMTDAQSDEYGCRNTFTMFLDTPRLSEDVADVMWDLMRESHEE